MTFVTANTVMDLWLVGMVAMVTLSRTVVGRGGAVVHVVYADDVIGVECGGGGVEAWAGRGRGGGGGDRGGSGDWCGSGRGRGGGGSDVTGGAGVHVHRHRHAAASAGLRGKTCVFDIIVL